MIDRKHAIDQDALIRRQLKNVLDRFKEDREAPLAVSQSRLAFISCMSNPFKSFFCVCILMQLETKQISVIYGTTQPHVTLDPRAMHWRTRREIDISKSLKGKGTPSQHRRPPFMGFNNPIASFTIRWLGAS